MMQKEEGKSGLGSFLGNRQQHPIAVGPPLFFEVDPFYAKQFATSGVMDKHRVVLPVDARHHYVVQRRFGAARLEAHNQRTPLLQMFFKIRPTPIQKEHLESRAVEIIFHVRSEDAPRFARIELLLDCGGVRALSVDWHAMPAPILQDHGDGRGSAAILALFDEWYVQPDSRAFLRRRLQRSPQEQRQEQSKRGPLSARDR